MPAFAGDCREAGLADRRAVQAEALVLKVYCPDTLHRIQEQIEDLKTDQTVRR
ncbi:hypothetical protein OG756_36370 [Streptomyces sp. NBC_01310]|uniref:hypothetical protein n=1 Tax=Streptomyces sp. NBC_01310 TaxID=2903820 RepID=UPI0035B64667|nr:hypothetical protein OG756_36370 [Streptomyces sp. NBC_01310]